MINKNDILTKAIDTLKNGGTILYPTDTVWGLGCDARNVEAVKKINSIKKRGTDKSFIVLLDTENKLDSYLEEIPAVAFELIEYAENPLTIIYPGAKNLAAEVINEDNSVAIRIVKAGFVNELLKRYRFPIVSTSANISGEPSPEEYEDISEEILQAVDLICEVPDTGTGKPSAIMKLKLNGEFSFLRK